MDWLVPVVAALHGLDAANMLLDCESSLVEDDELVSAIVVIAGDVETARSLITLCREAEGLDEFRRSVGVSLAAFNTAASALGPRFPVLRFEAALRRSFEERVDELRPSLATRVRDAFTGASLDEVDLDAYRQALSLERITFDEPWIDVFDELTDAVIDARIDLLAASTLPTPAGTADGPVDEVRHRNRDTLAAELESLRRVAAAWVSKSAERTLPVGFAAKSETLVRDAIVRGAFDFFVIAPASFPAALSRSGLWPAEMPLSSVLSELGLTPTDLDVQRKTYLQSR